MKMASLVGTKCEGCSEGVLERSSYTRAVSHNGKHGSIGQIGLTCDYCGLESFGREEIAFNKRALVTFQMQAEGISPSEIRAMRKRAGLSSDAAGELFGGGEKAFSKYENAQLLPDAAMRGLLLLAINYPDTIDKLRAAKAGRPYALVTVDTAAIEPYNMVFMSHAIAAVEFGSAQPGGIMETLRLAKTSALSAHVDTCNLGHELVKSPRYVYRAHKSAIPWAGFSSTYWYETSDDEREGL